MIEECKEKNQLTAEVWPHLFLVFYPPYIWKVNRYNTHETMTLPWDWILNVRVCYDRDSVTMLSRVLWTPSLMTYCLVPQELLYEASVTPFKCLNTEKSEHTKVRLSLVIGMQTCQSGHQEKWRTWRLLSWIHSCVCTAEGNFTDQGRLWVKTEVQHHLLIWNSFH